MEEIINFMQQYWGVAIGGGVTIGMVITFIWVQIKTYVQNKFRNAQLQAALDRITETITANQELTEQLRTERSANATSRQITLVTFNVLSHLVMASKLITEDKISLQNDIARLAEVVTPGVVPQPAPVGDTDGDAPVAPSANVIVNTVKLATTLLEKYTGAE